MDKNEIILYQTQDGSTTLDVMVENETVWLNQAQMVMLFGREQSVISRHIRNIFREGELDEKVVYAKFAYTTQHGAIKKIWVERFSPFPKWSRTDLRCWRKLGFCSKTN